MKINEISVLVLMLSSLGLYGQTPGMKASIDESFRLHFEETTIPDNYFQGAREANVIEGFPFGRPGNPTFKNTRGVTLADIDQDGHDEILFGADKTFYVIKHDGTILWEQLLTGIIILPPSVADVDGDESPDIALNTAGLGALQAFGRVHLFNADGTDKDGWPLNFTDRWMINAPALSDVDGDGMLEIITSERVSGTLGYVHVIKVDGTSINENWPVELPATPAFTPSAGDISGDGIKDIVIGQSTLGILHVFGLDGMPIEGFPQTPAISTFSYQSPLLADLSGDGNLEIVGSRHGDNPEYYAVKSDGSYLEGWPVAAPGWTYSPPAVVDTDADGSYEIYMGNPNTSGGDEPVPLDVVFGFNPDGTDLPNFPIEKIGGNEGVITIADIDDNGVVDILFTSNLTTLETGEGFIHAFATDGSGELEGFPVMVRGSSFMNSALLGDINLDGNLDMVTLSYTSTFGQSLDSVFVTAFDLGHPYVAENIYFNGYKGSNDRAGLIMQESLSTSGKTKVEILEIFPNPGAESIEITLPETFTSGTVLTVFDLTGKVVQERSVNSDYAGTWRISAEGLAAGTYIIQLRNGDERRIARWIKQ
jgi:hypothetical protein